MKIAVCAKVVPAAVFKPKLDPETFRLVRSTVCALNPWDKHAIEEGLRLREALGEGEVVVLSMGPREAGKPLREALAMGADRTVLVADDAAAGSDLVATSRVLATALAREGPDLVLFGQQADDSEGALLPAAVADRLRVPVLSKAARLELSSGRVSSRRQSESGYEVLEAPAPCVISVTRSINEPRYASAKGMLEAQKKEQCVLSLSDLGVAPEDAGEAGSRTEVRALGNAPRRRETRIVSDDGAGAETILEYLASQILI